MFVERTCERSIDCPQTEMRPRAGFAMLGHGSVLVGQMSDVQLLYSSLS